MSEPLPKDTYFWAIAPPPQWPLSADPQYQAWVQGPQSELDSLEFARATIDAFAPFAAFDFEPAGLDALELTDIPAALFLRGDALMIVGLVLKKTFFVLLGARLNNDNTLTASDRIHHLLREKKPYVTFGSFPLLATNAAEATPILRDYAELLVAASFRYLAEAPLDFVKLREAIVRIERKLSQDNWIGALRRDAENAWNEERWDRVVQSYEMMQSAVRLTDDERRRLDQVRSLIAARPRKIKPGEERDHDWWQRKAALINEKYLAFRETFRRRGESPSAMTAWRHATDELSEAGRDYSDALNQVEENNPDGLEAHIIDLEADLFTYASGYEKQRRLRILLRHQFTPTQAQRLRRVVLNVVDKGDRQEFRDYCKLGRKVDTPEFRAELLERLRGTDFGRARRALFALWFLPDLQLAQDDVQRARAIILRLAADRKNVWAFFPDERSKRRGWAKWLAKKFWDNEWETELLALAHDPEHGFAARRVLWSAARVAVPDDGESD